MYAVMGCRVVATRARNPGTSRSAYTAMSSIAEPPGWRIDSSRVSSLRLTKKIMGRFWNNVWKVLVAQIERSAHHMTCVERDTPAARMRNLGDQAMGVEAAKGAADLGTLLSGIISTVA